MATSICNVLMINLANFNSGTPVAARTYTATRQLRLYDLKVLQIGNPGQGSNIITVSNGASLCITKLTPGGAPSPGDVMRLGQAALDRVDDSQMVVAAGGTCVFAVNDIASVDATLYAYPL
tara:strand:+ start:632 stop:994 length:363 start_codon:yes stop_codon:yes gene_type:complete